MRIIWKLRTVIVCACLLATSLLLARADGVQLGNMPADKILFLGNSITACQRTQTSLWGLSASTAAKDYAHLLVGKLDAKTGGRLAMIPTIMPYTNPDGSIAQGGSNVVNIADVFERGYASYNASKISNQLAWKPNIVVLQFGENIPNTAQAPFDAAIFKTSLRTLLNDLKQNSNPEIFVTSYIMGEPAGVGNIKRELCAEDPTHRTFVDLSAVLQDPTNVGEYAHPSDKGMAVIADTLFNAMVTHSVPEPTSLMLTSTSLVAVAWYAWKKRN